MMHMRQNLRLVAKAEKAVTLPLQPLNHRIPKMQNNAPLAVSFKVLVNQFTFLC